MALKLTRKQPITKLFTPRREVTIQAASKSERSGKSAGNAARKKAKKLIPVDCSLLSPEQIAEILRKHQESRSSSQLGMLKNYQNFIQEALPSFSYSHICEMLLLEFKFQVQRSTLSTYVRQSMPQLSRPSRKKGSAGSTNDRKALKSAVAIPIPPVQDDFEQVGRSTERGENGPTMPVTLRTAEVTSEKLASPSPSSTSKPTPKVNTYKAAATR